MFLLGKVNELTVLRVTSVGMYLGDDEGNDILLPTKYIQEDFQIGDKVDVFVYKDHEQRWIATTLRPYVMVNEFAYLKVRDSSAIGAFLEWGVEKDLFVPFKEQRQKLEAGRYYVVYIYIDEITERIAASTKLNRYFQNDQIDIEPGSEVDLLIYEATPLGYNAIINQQYKGLIYHDEVFQPIQIGMKMRGFIKLIREDGGIDISLQAKGVKRLEEGAERILAKLATQKGFLKLHDKSTPDDITRELNMSKKNFKKSVGILYKLKKISLEEEGIRLIP